MCQVQVALGARVARCQPAVCRSGHASKQRQASNQALPYVSSPSSSAAVRVVPVTARHTAALSFSYHFLPPVHPACRRRILGALRVSHRSSSPLPLSRVPSLARPLSAATPLATRSLAPSCSHPRLDPFTSPHLIPPHPPLPPPSLSIVAHACIAHLRPTHISISPRAVAIAPASRQPASGPTSIRYHPAYPYPSAPSFCEATTVAHLQLPHATYETEHMSLRQL